jgi:hypothetical protein
MDTTTDLNKTQERQLIEAAFAELVGFGLKRDDFDAGRAEGEVSYAVIFANKESGEEVCVSGIFFNAQTGEILQCGQNYGRLTL